MVLAESDATVVFEGTRYFSELSIDALHVRKTARIYHCPKRGYGLYLDLFVNGNSKNDAAVLFAHPYPEAVAIAGRLCFLYGVEIVE